MGRFEIATGSAAGLPKKTGTTLEQEVWFLLQAHMKALEGISEESRAKAEAVFMDGVRRMRTLEAISEQALTTVDAIIHGGVAPKHKKKTARRQRTDFDNCRGTTVEEVVEVAEYDDYLQGGGGCGSDNDRRC